MIHFIRHTKVSQPYQGLCYGCSDVDLCPETWVETLPDILAHLPQGIERVYTSPLSRCRVLAEHVARHLSLPEAIDDERLLEINFGRFELKTWDEIHESPEGKAWFEDYLNCRTPGGESFADMQVRVREFLNEKAGEGDMLIVSHAGLIRAAMVAMGLVPAEEVFSLPVDCGKILSY